MKPFFIKAGRQLINMNELLHAEIESYTDGNKKAVLTYRDKEKPVSFYVTQGWVDEFFEQVKLELVKRNV